MFRLKLAGLLFTALLGYAKGIAQDTLSRGRMLTLQECVDIAIKNNLQVKISDLAGQSARVNRNQAIDYLLPSISANASQGVNMGKSVNPVTYSYVNQTLGTGSYGINTNLLLFAGLQVESSIGQYGFAYEAAKLDLQQQKDNITLNVLLDYMQVLSNIDVLAISREQALTDSNQLQRLKILFGEGSLPVLSDYSDLQGQYAGDKLAIVNAVNALESSKITLFNVLNIPYSRDAQYESMTPNPSPADYGADPDSIYQTALRNLPEIKSADLKIKSSRKALQFYRGAYFPTLSAYGNFNSNYSSSATSGIPGSIVNQQTSDFVTVGGTVYNVFTPSQNFTFTKVPLGQQISNDLYTSFGLSLNLPILNSLRARNNVKLAKITLENTIATAHNTRLVLQQQVEQAYQNMLSAYGQLKAYTDQVTAFAESFRITEIRFNNGVVNSSIYVIAKNNIDRARVNLSVARYAYIFRTKILDYYQGRLMW
jgi:outer membrane protein